MWINGNVFRKMYGYQYKGNHMHHWHEKEAHLSGPWQPCSIDLKRSWELTGLLTPVDVYNIALKP